MRTFLAISVKSDYEVFPVRDGRFLIANWLNAVDLVLGWFEERSAFLTCSIVLDDLIWLTSWLLTALLILASYGERVTRPAGIAFFFIGINNLSGTTGLRHRS